MEDNNRFFQFVWRFNAIMLMTGGILAILLLLFAGYQIIRDATRERTVGSMVNVAEDEVVAETQQLGGFYKISGSPFVMVALTSDQSYDRSYYSKSASSVRNYAFINAQNNQKRWLLPTSKHLITNFEFITDSPNPTDSSPVKAIVYQVISQDTNGDNRLTGEDQTTIAMSSPSGLNYKPVVTEIDKFIGQYLVDDNNLLLVYQKENRGYTVNVSLTDFTVSNTDEFPELVENP